MRKEFVLEVVEGWKRGEKFNSYETSLSRSLDVWGPEQEAQVLPTELSVKRG